MNTTMDKTPFKEAKPFSVEVDENNLLESDTLFRLLAESSLTGIWIHEDYVIIYANDRYAELLGYKTEDLIGSSIWDRVPEQEKKLFEERRALRQSGMATIENYEINMLHRDGTARCMEVFSSDFTFNGRSARMGNMVDVTDRKNAEIKLHQALLKVEHVSRAKTEFLANMSHELRTPMTMINGGAEILKTQFFGELGDPRYLDFARDIEVSGKLLLNLINDLLDTARIDLGTMEISEENVDVVRVLKMCERLMVDRVHKRKLTLNIECSEDPLCMYADETRLKQILLNLLTNAIKFTPAGGKVTVKVQINSDGELEFSVSDTGIGIAKENLDKVLNKFVQVENFMTRSHEGAGIGLSLCKDFVEIHNGSMRIESELGKGTTVTVCFPAARIVEL